MKKYNVVTYESLEQRLKNKPKEQWTREDVFDRYIGYGSPEEIEDLDVQKLFIKYELYEELIDLVSKVVEKILDSNIFENKKIKKIKGKIKTIKISDIENDNIDELKQVSIIFEKKDNLEKIKINDYCLTQDTNQYLENKKKYKNKIMIAIVEKNNKNLNLKCFCLK